MSAIATAMPVADAVPPGIHSPPDSNSAMKDGGSDSELSDLDPEHDTTKTYNYEPDHISEGNVPVFRPTMHDFEDFSRYLNGINKWGMKHGIVKVIPPAEWAAAQPRLDEIVKPIKVKEPIKQEIMGTAGTYRQANILHGRSYNLPQWRQLCDQSDHQPPAKRGERRANQDKPRTSARFKSSGSPSPSPSAPKQKGPGRPSKKSKLSKTESVDGTVTPDRLPTPVSPGPKAEQQSVKLEADEEVSMPKLGSRQAKAISVSSRRKNNRKESGVVDEAAFKDFKYDFECEPFSQERCDELERVYWKTLTYAPPLYGADMPGSLFDDRTTTWNLGKLENILDVIGTKIPGVNTAYLYLGMWKATFAWHLEDVDLYSINYLHFGAPKQWYSISQGDARRFEAAMKNIWPADAKACDQFLRHKTFLISPAHLLAHYNIRVNKIVSHPGEFVITYPYGYHSGYNLGYNCAEAVNFALESWLEYGRVAKRCDCDQAQDSVWIDVREIERKLRGEETDYESTDDEDEDDMQEDDDNKPTDLPTPPESSGDTKLKAPRKKRKRSATDKGDKVSVKRIRVRIKAPAREPCILCPNDISSEQLLPTEDGKEAHRICAQYIPETNIDSGDKELVTDVKYINKARLDLKCLYCRSRRGACFQCSRKKCTRSYHATCAAAAGVFVEQGEMAVFGEDGKEYKEWGIEFSCRFHRSKRDKKLDGDALGDDKRTLKAASELKKGETCQMQYYNGEIFAGVVVENRPGEETLLVDILPRGDRLEVEYKWLLLADPSDYHLQKPSPNATAMPKSFKAKESLNTSKRQIGDLPRAEDKFGDGLTWAEFKSEAIPRNPFQVKIELVSKENQIWFYLGKTSTEARAQFTEDPRKPIYNHKGNFLETIPKVVAALPPRPSFPVSYPASLSRAIQTASKPPIRPNQQALTPVQAKPEKPYVYKPRDTTFDSYRVDAQAYQSQQNFLQRSTPQYSFGTDPRWQSTGSAAPAVNSSTQHAAITPPVAKPSTALSPAPKPVAHTPAVIRPPVQNHTTNRPSLPATYAPPPKVVYTPPVKQTYVPPPKNAYAPTPNPKAAQNQAAKTPSVLMAPPHTAYRSTFTPPVAQKPATTHFSSRSQLSRPSPFAKYAYLQKEHNRSPLEYKTPYRPGGGFMNGYQGSLEKHLQQTLFRNSSTGTPNKDYSTLSSYGQSSKSPYPSASPTPVPIVPRTPSTSSNGAYVSPPASTSKSTPTPPTQPIRPAQAAQTPTTWDKKDTSQLHPAIRQQYSTMFQPQWQPPPRATQQQNPVMQPPAMYGQTQQIQSPYQPPYQPAYQPGQSPQTSQTQPYIPGRLPYSSHDYSVGPPVPRVANSTPPVTHAQQYQYTPAVSHSLPQYHNGQMPQYVSSGHPLPTGYQSSTQSEYQAGPQTLYQESKPVYAHQQFFQNQKPVTGTQAPLYQPKNDPHVRDPPDVPADSTSLVEKMLNTLKRATPFPPPS